MSSQATSRQSSKDWLSYVFAFTLLLVAAFSTWFLRPFPDLIDAKSVPVFGLSKAQRGNIQLAARYLDQAIIKPGETFSFNRQVGPRTSRRGYLPAPTYIDKSTSATIGGGICLVSSCLYQLALEAGLRINARTPHLRPISTVAPGLDATVSYGQSSQIDLAFTNVTSGPLKIVAASDGSDVRIELWGTRSTVALREIRTHQSLSGPTLLAVEVIATEAGCQSVISHDRYLLPIRHR